jgi:hypothetical protein
MWLRVGRLSVVLWDQKRIWRHDGKPARGLGTPQKRRSGSYRKGEPREALQAGTSLRALVFPAKTARRHNCEFLSAGATQPDNDNVGQSSLPYLRERGPARAGRQGQEGGGHSRSGRSSNLIAVRHAELALEIPKQSHQFLLLLGTGLLRTFNVNCVLKGGGGKREERWSSEESAAADGSGMLTELADRHSPWKYSSRRSSIRRAVRSRRFRSMTKASMARGRSGPKRLP